MNHHQPIGFLSLARLCPQEQSRLRLYAAVRGEADVIATTIARTRREAAQTFRLGGHQRFRVVCGVS